jgi:hypothetical protein
MVSAFRAPLTAADIKAKARALGADLVGIADGDTLERHPPDPRDPRRPSNITDLDAGRVIVLATFHVFDRERRRARLALGCGCGTVAATTSPRSSIRSQRSMQITPCIF